MNAVERLYRNRRFHEVTLDDVARDAHVGKGTIYRFFTDKEDLFFQTATAGFDELCEVLDEPALANAEFPERLLGACTQITRYFSRRRHLIRMMASEEGRVRGAQGELKTRWLERRQKLVDALARLLNDGMERGYVRRGVLATYLLSLLRARSQELESAPPEMASLELLLDIFWRGIRDKGDAARNDSPGASTKAEGKRS